MIHKNFPTNFLFFKLFNFLYLSDLSIKEVLSIPPLHKIKLLTLIFFLKFLLIKFKYIVLFLSSIVLTLQFTKISTFLKSKIFPKLQGLIGATNFLNKKGKL